MIRDCTQCGTSFSVQYPSAKRKTCSPACQTKARRSPRPRRSDAGKRRTEWPTFTCPCGNTFEAPRWEAAKRNRTYCSAACNNEFNKSGGRPPVVMTATPVAMVDGELIAGNGQITQLRRVDGQGYVWIFLRPEDRPVGWRKPRVSEHRWVMMQQLGRDLFPHENVHHINGDKGDNRPGNLELWVVSQPKGQRASELLAWAREIIATYEPIEDAVAPR